MEEACCQQVRIIMAAFGLPRYRWERETSSVGVHKVSEWVRVCVCTCAYVHVPVKVQMGSAQSSQFLNTLANLDQAREVCIHQKNNWEVAWIAPTKANSYECPHLKHMKGIYILQIRPDFLIPGTINNLAQVILWVELPCAS